MRFVYSAMVWIGLPMFLLGCELEAARSVSWAWPVLGAVMLLSVAGDRAEAAKRQQRELVRLDRDLVRYQREDRGYAPTYVIQDGVAEHQDFR